MKQILIVFSCIIYFVIGYFRIAYASPPRVTFTEVTKQSNLSTSRNLQTYSAAAGDFNNDGYQDLVVSHHGSFSLWKNNKDGTFSDVTTIFDKIVPDDIHGVSFIDLNNDDLLDIAFSVGAERGRGKGANQFYINKQGASFAFFAAASPIIAYEEGRGRSITPADINHDGKLDLLLFGIPQKNREQRIAIAENIQDGDFFSYKAIGLKGGIELSRAFSCMLIGFDRKQDTFFVLNGLGKDSGKIFTQNSQAFSEITENLGVHSRLGCFTTVAPFDYDNDGDLDLFYGRSMPPPVHLAGVNEEGGINFVINNRHKFNGFSAQVGPGNIEIDIRFEGQNTLQNLYLGGSRSKIILNPDSLSLANPMLSGDPRLSLEDAKGGYLWLGEDGRLNFQFIGDDSLQEVQGYIKPIGFQFTDFKHDLSSQALAADCRNSLYRNDNGHFVDMAKEAWVQGKGQAFTAIAADFNNDGFVDLYTGNAGQSLENLNMPNELFINNGNGTFVETAETSGALGPNSGMDNGAIAFDYDNDGDLDLFLYNGFVTFPVEPGPFVLLRNDSSTEYKSVEIDVRGNRLNRRGIGTKLIAYEQDQKMFFLKYGHNGFLATSDLPLHIGIGRREKLAGFTMIWPDGHEQIIGATPAGAKFTLREKK